MPSNATVATRRTMLPLLAGRVAETTVRRKNNTRTKVFGRVRARLQQLSPSGGDEEIRDPTVRVVRRVSALQRPRGGRDYDREPFQFLHDPQHERAGAASQRAGNAGDGRVYQISVDRRAAGGAAVRLGHRQDAGARSPGRSGAWQGGLHQCLRDMSWTRWRRYSP